MSDYDRMQRANVELQKRIEELEAQLAEYKRATLAEWKRDQEPPSVTAT